MKLIDLLTVLNFDETIHVRNSDDTTIFFGKAGNAYSEIDESTIRNNKVNYVFTCFCCVCIDVADEN